MSSPSSSSPRASAAAAAVAVAASADGNRTMTLEDFRAALLVEQPEDAIANWKSPNDFILQTVSAQDLDEALKRITIKMDTLKQELTNASLALAPLPSSLSSSTTNGFQVQPSDALDTISQLHLELERCNQSMLGESAKPDSSLIQFEAAERERQETSAQRVMNLQRLLAALDQLATHQRAGVEFDAQLDAGAFLQACDSLQRMESCMVQLSQIASSAASDQAENEVQNSVSASRVAKACRVQWKVRRAALLARLDEAFKQAITFDIARQEMRICLDIVTAASPTAVRLERVVEAMHALKILVPRLADRVLPKLKEVFLDVLLGQQQQQPQLAVEVNVENMNLPTIRLVPGVADSPRATNLEDVQTLCRFIWSELFNRESKFMSQLNLQSVLGPMLKSALKQNIPNEFKDLSSFRTQMLDRVTKFDHELARLGVLGDADDRLARFVSEVDVNFAKRLREQIALMARQAIVKEHATAQRVDEGVEPEFFVVAAGNLSANNSFAVSSEMRISKAVRQVVSIANQALVDATLAQHSNSTPVCTEYLIRACRDCFDLCRILLPFIRRKDLANSAHVAMLHRNDFSYLAHHLVLLGHRHAVLMPTLITVDLAPAFFDEADRVFQAEVALRSSEIEQYFTMANFDADALGRISAKADAIVKAWTEAGLPQSLSEDARRELGDALCNGAFAALCSSDAASVFASSNDSSSSSSAAAMEKERRNLLRKLGQFMEPIRNTSSSSGGGAGSSLRRLEQLCQVLQPHMSLPLFVDYIETENLGQEWTAENMVNLARNLFRHTCTERELQDFEDKLLYY